MHFQSAQLASLYVMHGLPRAAAAGAEPRYRLGSLESGTLLCQAFEAYLELHIPARISFEHAWYLLSALGKRDEIGMSRCVECGGLRLRDLLARQRQACATCGHSPAAQTPAAPRLMSHALPC